MYLDKPLYRYVGMLNPNRGPSTPENSKHTGPSKIWEHFCQPACNRCTPGSPCDALSTSSEIPTVPAFLTCLRAERPSLVRGLQSQTRSSLQRAASGRA
jgi:hypothetical protein